VLIALNEETKQKVILVRKDKVLCSILETRMSSSCHFVCTSSVYFISGIYQVSLFCSIWHDNNHWSSCGVRHDWNVWWSFWPGSWYLPLDYHPGVPIINTFKLLTRPKYFFNNYCSHNLVMYNLGEYTI